MRTYLLTLILVAMAIPRLGYTDDGAALRSVEVSDFDPAQNRHDFKTSDGFRLNWVQFPSPFNDHPILILPGKGKSVFRYVQFAHDLAMRGQGPIFLLELRDQGFSARSNPSRPRSMDIDSFDTYVSDVLQFVDNPLKQTLGADMLSRLNIISESMGGAVLNLVLQKRPDIAARIVQIAPAFELDSQNHVLNAFHEAGAKFIANFLCLVGCEQFHLSPDSHANASIADRAGRLASALKKENLHGIEVQEVTYRWVREFLRATTRIKPTANVHSLLFSAAHDRVVRSSAIYDFACQASNCTLIQLHGTHDLVGTTGKNVYAILLDKIDEFLKNGSVQYFQPSLCAKILRESH